MVYIPQAEPNGPYWAEETVPREFCYSIVPVEEGKPKFVHNSEWIKLYNCLGELGYLFRDCGRNSEHIVVSLDKPLTKRHLKKLEGVFLINQSDGSQLGFC